MLLALLVLSAPANAAGSYTAYVANGGQGTLTPIDTATNTPGTAIAAGGSPSGVAITPDGTTAYVADLGSDSVTPIDTATGTPGTAIGVGNGPYAVAITPDGTTVYVANRDSNSLTPIDTATNTAGVAIATGNKPIAVAITPDGATAYVADYEGNTVTPIDTATGTAGAAIPVGSGPDAIAVTPDGETVYVANSNSNTVTPIDTATNAPGTPIGVGGQPYGIAIAPDGNTAYVVNNTSDSVTPIDTATNTAGTAIAVGTLPNAVAITPDGKTLYVTDAGFTWPVDTATGAVGAAITTDLFPDAVAVSPDQAPVAAFSATPARAGGSSPFDASASSDPDGTVASYHWDFGDGHTATTTSATTTHTYAAAGSYAVTVTAIDDAGCSTAQIFTGQTVSCQGSPSARVSHQITVLPAVVSSYTAYTANHGSDSVTPIDTATNAAGMDIVAGNSPAAVAVTPDGKTLYVVDRGSGSVTPIDTATGIEGTPIADGGGPDAVAISPDGKTVYVANFAANSVTPIDTATGTAGTAITVGSQPDALAITPDGKAVYVANFAANSVTPIDTATGTAGTAISVGSGPSAVAITPDGKTAYVTNSGSNSVTPIDTATGTAGSAITVGTNPDGVAITPDGTTAYVANTGSGSVTPIDTATGTGGSVITVGGSPHAVAVAPDGKTVYVTSLSPNSVTPIDTATGTAGNAIPVGSNPLTLAISPDQPPVAAFSVTHAHVGAAATFDASASSDQEGTIASYRWDFGDGQTATTTSAMTSHTYAAPGSYTVTVTETDDAGCSTTEIFTGQTVSCDGSSLARVSHQVSIEPPAITSASQTAFKTARAGSFTVTSTGSPTPSLSESGAMPRGVSFTDHGDGTASLAGTPEAATGGSYPITIKASNGVSPDASQSFTLTVQSPPTASIATPAAGATYAKGQVVHSSFTCDEGAGGPGIASCLDQRGRGSGALLDTSSTGQHTFSVTATSSDGLTGATPVTYTVNAPGGKPPAAPVLSGLKVRPHAFRVATKGSARSKSGATISYRDTLAAETTLRVVDRVAGVKQRGACVAAPTRKHRGTGKRCTRVVLIGSIGHRDAAGTNRLRFTGRLRGHALAPGRYKLIASARQAAQHSGTISARFRILNQ